MKILSMVKRKTIKVKIIKSSKSTYWYNNRIGEKFVVYMNEDESNNKDYQLVYPVTTGYTSYGDLYIDKEDCEIAIY